jgi:hypothetical protein
LKPSGDQKLLNNLRIGPAVGRKQDIMRNWCAADETGACVKCTPENPNGTTNYVEIQLRRNPKVEREQLPEYGRTLLLENSQNLGSWWTLAGNVSSMFVSTISKQIDRSVFLRPHARPQPGFLSEAQRAEETRI